MAGMLTPKKADVGWILEIPQEMALMMKVDPKSIVVLYPKEGALEAEILAAPTAELKDDFDRIFDKYYETFEALKRIGD